MNMTLYKMKMKNSFSGKSGFTLVEVIITLVITVIVIAVSSSLVITGTNIFARSAQRDVQQNIAETVLTFVSEQLLYAETITEMTNPPVFENAGGAAIMQIKKSTTETYSDTKGQLFFRRAQDSQNPINIFGSNFYGNYEVGITLEITIPAAGPSVTVTVNVYSSNSTDPNPVITRTTTRPLLNYTGTEKTIPSAGSGFCIYYVPRVFS